MMPNHLLPSVHPSTRWSFFASRSPEASLEEARAGMRARLVSMCGIAGILTLDGGERVRESTLLRLRDEQIHRGPDDAGLWIAEGGRVGLGHRRLSIIDLSSSGHQPMHSEDQAVHVVFNGEIYNFEALRAELEEAGYVFRSSSDTEVLLHGYREWGLDLLGRLRGMFAFALHDSERQRTLLARDPLGIKPLYYASVDGQFFFASEVQAIRTVADCGGVDPEAVASYLHWGCVGAPRTLYRSIRALPAGFAMWVREGRVSEPRAYFDMAEFFQAQEKMDVEEAQVRIRRALLDSVRSHMISDVEVGSFLSGGVDSASLVGLMSEVHDAAISTVNLSFELAELDEGPLAESAAAFYGSHHHRVDIRIDESRDQLGEAVHSLDQPSADGINTYFASQAAVQAGLKVAVSGVGGDELFGGYANFRKIPELRRIYRRLARIPGFGSLRPIVVRGLAELPRHPRLSVAARALASGDSASGAYYAKRSLFTGAEVRKLITPEYRDSVEAADPARDLDRQLAPERLPEDEQTAFLEFQQYMQKQLLRDTDVMSMRHSLEVRTPLVDHHLARELFKVPPELRMSGPAKLRLRESVRPELPESFWNRRKRGFSLPFEYWLKNGSISLELPEHPILDRAEVVRVARDFQNSRLNYARLWGLMTLTPFLE